MTQTKQRDSHTRHADDKDDKDLTSKRIDNESEVTPKRNKTMLILSASLLFLWLVFLVLVAFYG